MNLAPRGRGPRETVRGNRGPLHSEEATQPPLGSLLGTSQLVKLLGQLRNELVGAFLRHRDHRDPPTIVMEFLEADDHIDSRRSGSGQRSLLVEKILPCNFTVLLG